MRLKLKLKLLTSNLISANYHYALSSAIYKLLSFGSEEFAEFLHDKGYKTNGKNYKLFNFALKFKRPKILKDVFLLEDKEADLFISSPLIDNFVKNFVVGTFNSKQIELKANNTLSKFSIEQAEFVPEPNFYVKNKFLLYSPLVLSKRAMRNGKPVEYYFRFNDDIDELNWNMNNNLKNKYKVLFNKEYDGEGLEFEWDNEYLERQLKKGKNIQKRILITSDINNAISVIGMQAPFYLVGDRELMKVGYECGFGKSNSMGFGMAKIIN